MAAPVNRFKKSLKEGRQTIGCWLTQGTAIAAEIAATADFDWLLIDTEHSPNDLPSVLAQLQTDTGADVLKMLVTAFLEELDGRLTTLRDLCAEERWADLRHEAHTIKGSSATFGAAALSQAAKRIENACDDGQVETIKQDVDAFPALARKTRSALIKALKLKLSRGQAAA